MSDEAKWYVVHTYSGYENKVASTLQTTVENRGLQDMILDAKVPTETVTEVREDGSVKEVERKLYPGYVFVKMVYTDETWYVVRNIRGCTGFVGPSSKPVPLTESEVYKMGVEQRVDPDDRPLILHDAVHLGFRACVHRAEADRRDGRHVRTRNTRRA